jgi:hypothetical protein
VSPSTTVLGQLPTVAAATIQMCSSSTAAAAGGSQATTAVYTYRLPMLQLRKISHFTKDCRQPKQCNAPHVLAIRVNQQRGSAPRTDRINYTIVDEIPTREEVLAGTFLLNEHPIIILFDSEASHDFMSSTCAKKARLALVASGAPYVISTLGGLVDADWIV